MTTRTEKVKEFTELSLNTKVPTRPRLMTRDEVLFVVRMNCEELQELLLTVCTPEENVKHLLTHIVNTSNSPIGYCYDKTDVELMAEQVDAFVDIDYYNGNAAAKVGFNVDQVFDVVHTANMNKRFEDGTFHRNSLGKVVKPPNWSEADVVAIVEEWLK